MSDEESYELLGFDNLLLPVGDLAEAVPFYERAGFTVGFRLDEAGIAILKVGGETPGVLLRQEDGLGHRPPPGPRRACGWRCRTRAGPPSTSPPCGIELLDAPFSVATGWTVEIADPWGNVIGFTDYSKRPELARRV